MTAISDRIDDLLDPACDDVHAMATLLAEAERDGVAHPGLQSLSLKSASLRERERLEAASAALALEEDSKQEDEDEDEDGDEFDMLAPLHPPLRQQASRSTRRVAPAPAADARWISPTTSTRRGSIAAAAAQPLSGTSGLLGRRRSVLNLPGAAGGRRGSLSPALVARRGSVLLPPRSLLLSLGASSPGSKGENGAGAAAPLSVQVAGPAGRRTSVSVQMESLEALFEEDAEGEMKSEWRQVFALAVPLVLSNLADEISNIGLIALWGRLGTTALAAGNLCDSWMELALVIVYGFQQAMYSMVPQAAGAGNAKQVSNMLTMSVMWTCVILLLPVGVSYYFLGSFINVAESDGYGYGYGTADAAANTSGCGDEILPLLATAPAVGQEVLLEAELVEGELNETLALFLTDPAEDHEVVGEGHCDLQCTVTNYSRACILYLLPYILVETLRCWLGSLEIVALLAPNAGFWAMTRVPLYALLMFPFDLGLNGYAYGMMISTAGELLGTYLIVVLWKKPHLPWWNGVDWKGASDAALNWRFVKLGGAASVQLFASFASSAVLYTLMATRSEVHLAAYGVLQGFTNMGSSLSHALFTATSVCVGTRLGAGDPARSKHAALAGVVYNVLLGLGLASVMLSNPEGLSLLLVPNDEDAPTRKLVVDAIVPTAIYCILQAVQWGFWSVLEGQARVSITSVFIIVGWWVVAVPGSFLALHLNSLDPCSTDVAGGDSSGGNPSKDISLIMWCQCAGFLVCDLLMAYCVVFGDWQALSDEAVANAQEDENDVEQGTPQDANDKSKRNKAEEDNEEPVAAESPPKCSNHRTRLVEANSTMTLSTPFEFDEPTRAERRPHIEGESAGRPCSAVKSIEEITSRISDSPDSSPGSSSGKSQQHAIINTGQPPKDVQVPGAIPPLMPPAVTVDGHASVDGVTETVATAMIVLDEWLERWNALDEQVWTDSVLFRNPKHAERVRSKDQAANTQHSLPQPQQAEVERSLLLPTDEDAGGGGGDCSCTSKSFAHKLKALKAIGWHRSQWQRREVLIDDDHTGKVKLDTLCLRYSEDNQLLGEFASQYEIEKVSKEGRESPGGEPRDLWKVKFLGMNDLPSSKDKGDDDEEPQEPEQGHGHGGFPTI